MQQEAIPQSVMNAVMVQPQADEEADTVLQEKLAPIIGKLEAMCTTAVAAKRPLEDRWIRNTEQFNGEYSSEIRAQFSQFPDQSRIFVNITRAKTTNWEARLGDLLFPTDDKNWGIKPTPVPSLTDNAQMVAERIIEAERQAESAVQESNAMVEAGADPQAVAAKQAEAQEAADVVQTGRQLDAMIQGKLTEAKKRAEKMEAEIADQLSECNYSATSRSVIADGCKLGSAILKGPVTIDRPVRRWGQRGGNFDLDMETEIKPEYRRVNPWDFYPDPDVGDIQDAAFTFERHAVNRHKLKKMAKTLGFHMPSVRALLREPAGHSANADLSYLTQLRAMNMDVAGNNYTPTSLYVVWEFHGYLETEDVVSVLRNFGKNDVADEIERANDPFDERRVIAYMCNGRILKLSADYPMDSNETLYSVFSFEKPEGSILGGPGIPEMMKHEQAMLNAGVRMLMDNAGLAVAPQAVIDKAAIEPTDSRWNIAPRKTWYRKGPPSSNPNDRPFEFFTVPMNGQLITVIIDMAMKFIDMVVSMPMIAQGEQGQATSTLGGMSMLFNSANVVFRRVVKNWDDEVTEPSIRRAFDWNMQFSDKEEIKGDMNVEARGTSVLLVREIQSQMMMAIATNWSAHPVLGTAIKVYDAMRLTLQAMAINPNDVLVTPEEFEKRLQKAAESQPESPDAIRAQASIEVAKISAKAQEMDGQTRLQIANLQRENLILELMVKGDVDTKRILASLEAQRMQVNSGERKLAVEAALEERNARRAEAMGREPTGSGGAISMGSEARP